MYPHPFAWYLSGCRTETYETMLGNTPRLVGYNWCVSSKLHWVQADDNSVARHQSRFIVFTLPRHSPWKFERGAPRFLPLMCLVRLRSYYFLSQDGILVDKLGCARLNDFGLVSIASRNRPRTSVFGFKGSYRWMAPELFKVEQNPSNSCVPTRRSDIFALGMVTFEVM